jgi:hypothetical protein
MYIVARRHWQDDLFPLFQSVSVRKEHAIQFLAFLGDYPQQRHGPSEHGDVWFQIESGTGRVISDSVVFPAHIARMILIQHLRAPADLITRRLSKEYAEGIVAQTKKSMQRGNRYLS